MNPLAFLVLFSLLARNIAGAAVGIDWGRHSAQKLAPADAVKLLAENNITQIRVFTGEVDIIAAFAGTGIELTVSIANASAVDTVEKARSWVHDREPYFIPSIVRHVNVADYAFFNGMTDKAMLNDTIEALQCMQKALNDAHYGYQIKVTIPHHSAILNMNGSPRPSKAEFRDEIKPEMARFLRIIQQNNAPFVVTINPIIHVQELGVDMDFTMFDNKSSLVVKDVDGAEYTNVFELMYDAYVWALAKLNVSDVAVVVGQVGWPTDGLPAANATMAERFFKGFLPWAASNKGTPMRPGAPIEVFIHSLMDEDAATYGNSANIAQHFGIYRSDGKPKYKIDLSGQGHDTYPTGKGYHTRPNGAIFVLLLSILGTLLLNQ